MAKSIDEEIADLNEQIKKLEAKKFELEHPHQEYPKYIADARCTVQNADEEKKVLAGLDKADSPAPISADEKRQADEVRAADEEARKYAVSRAKAQPAKAARR